MKKIVLLPLDERPCNYIYPSQIFDSNQLNVVLPPMSILGKKKQPANFDKIKEFLLEACKGAYGLVISLDMLLYGGIVPSRLHYDDVELLAGRLELLNTIKENNPGIKIYGFDLIMRCPQYSSDDEEPTYYQECGREIFLSGYLKHKIDLGIASETEKIKFNELDFNKNYLEDFLNRRKVNVTLNTKSLEYVKSNIIDFLIIPQDDASEYGYTALDQIVVRKIIEQDKLQLKVYMYPGADECANNLLSKMLCDINNKRPMFYIKYPSITSGSVIPCLEDRYLDTTVRYQILSSGGLVTTSVSEADIVLFVNASATKMAVNGYPTEVRDRGLTTLRNMPEFIEFLDYVINDLNKCCVVADVSCLNGSDKELIDMMQSKDLLLKVGGYAGWNTSSNTLGTCIPQGVNCYFNGNDDKHKEFLISRYIEDYGYMTHTRKFISDTIVAEKGYSYFLVDGKYGEVATAVKESLIEFVDRELPTIKNNYTFTDVHMPWNRMFEVSITIKYKK